MANRHARSGASGWWMVGLFLALSASLNAQISTPNAAPAIVTPSPTQPQTDDPATTKPEIQIPSALEIDLALMLQSPATELFPQTVDDPVWTIKPNSGRQLIQIPLIVRPESHIVELNHQTLRIIGGRLLCWRIDPTPMPDVLSPDIPQPENEPIDPSLANSQPPRLTRSVRIHPNNLTQWNMDRSLLNGTLKEPAQLYSYKIRPELMEKLAPVRPVAPGTPGTPGSPAPGSRPDAAAVAAYRTQMQNYQGELTKHNEFRRQVFKAPTRFHSPLPRVIWAVIEIRANQTELTLDGPTPLPWTISLPQWETLRNLSQPIQAGPDATLPSTTAQQLQQVIQRVQQDPHIWNQRAAVRAATLSQSVKIFKSGDPLHQLYQTILTTGEPQARQMVLNDLLSVSPATEAVLGLLKIAMVQKDVTSRALALQGLLAAGAWDDNLSQIAVMTANQLLQDPAGPPVDQLLGQWIAAVPVPAVAPASNETPQAAPAQTAASAMASRRAADLGTKVQMTVADPARQNRVVRYIIHQAPTQPLAQIWLNQRLLSSDQPALVKLTLQTLAQAQQIPPTTPGSHLTPGHPPAVPAPANLPEQGPIALSGLIPLNPPQDALFTLLGNKDKSLRELAWQALPQFAFPAQDAPAIGQTAANQPPATSPFQLFINAALATSPTPLPTIEFLVRQPNQKRATEALLVLVMAADAPGSAAAAKALVGSNRPISAVLQSYAPEDRHRFAVRLYKALTPKVPTVVNLLLERSTMGTNLANWLGQQVASGSLPAPNEWAEQAGNEQSLLALVTDSDATLAQGAASALVTAAGGQDDLAGTFITQMSGQPNRSPEFALSQWSKVKQVIHTLKLTKSAGSYRLVLRVYTLDVAQRLGIRADTDPLQPSTSTKEPTPPVTTHIIQPPGISPAPGTTPGISPGIPGTAPATAPAMKPELDAVLGVIALQADGKSVRFASQTVSLSVPDAYLAIRIDKPGELKNFPNDAVAKLKFEGLIKPIDLRPLKDGRWQARVLMPEDRLLELLLEPVK